MRLGGLDIGMRRGVLAVVGACALVGSIVAIGSSLSDESPAAASAAAPATSTTVPASEVERREMLDEARRMEDAAELEISDSGKLGWAADQPPTMLNKIYKGRSDRPLLPERRALLGEQLARARAAAMKAPTVADAEAAGYEKTHEFVYGRGVEYAKWSYVDDQFNIDEPELLAYEDDKPDSRIVSMAYNVLGVAETGPPKDLPLEVIGWHFHTNVCRKGDLYIGSDGYDCVGNGGWIDHSKDNWMVDLWVIPGWENPWGLISSKHPDLFNLPWYEEK